MEQLRGRWNTEKEAGATMYLGDLIWYSSSGVRGTSPCREPTGTILRDRLGGHGINGNISVKIKKRKSADSVSGNSHINQ